MLRRKTPGDHLILLKSFLIVNETGISLPKIPFERMKMAALGKSYKLNLIITGSSRMKELNTIYRGKLKPTDILSFPLSEDEGEIYISPEEAAKEAKKFGRDFDNFLAYLFIHGCVHLKGYDHGSTMELIEADLREKFKV